jgi:C-terminal processing protease CtpA/Prc
VTIVIEGPRRDARKLTSAGSVAMTLAERGSSLVILDVPEGGEAETAGIEPDDALTSINGKPVQRIEQARSLLGGPIGDDVVLELSRDMPGGKKERVRLRVRREAVRR